MWLWVAEEIVATERLKQKNRPAMPLFASVAEEIVATERLKLVTQPFVVQTVDGCRRDCRD